MEEIVGESGDGARVAGAVIGFAGTVLLRIVRQGQRCVEASPSTSSRHA